MATIKRIDFSIICGRRNKEEQNAAYYTGKSKVMYPESKHNSNPSLAFDVIPYPFNGWKDKKQFYSLANIMKEEANKLNINIKWGGDFKSFFDGPHFELEEE